MKRRFSASLHDVWGKRKYLTPLERSRFLESAKKADPNVMTLCLVLAYTGARLSEVLALKHEHIDYEAQCIIIECAKKRTKHIFRTVPTPQEVLMIIADVHHSELHDAAADAHIWGYCRTTAWSHVKKVMKDAGLSGVQATPKGLRHAFGVSAVQSGVSLNMVQKWMGHASIETTAIYTNAIGPEELSIAKGFWCSFNRPS